MHIRSKCRYNKAQIWFMTTKEIVVIRNIPEVLFDKTRTKYNQKWVYEHANKIKNMKRIDTIMETSYLSIQLVRLFSLFGREPKERLNFIFLHLICHIEKIC